MAELTVYIVTGESAYRFCADCDVLKDVKDFYPHNAACKACAVMRRVRWRTKLKREVLAHYGTSCACPYCHEDRIEFLSIDHIDGNGADHRESLGLDRNGKGSSGHHFYRWLKQNGFPPGFQTLCHSCNQAKKTNKECPHKFYVPTPYTWRVYA